MICMHDLATGGLRNGFYYPCEDVKSKKRSVVTSGTDRYPIGQGIEAIGLDAMAALLADL